MNLKTIAIQFARPVGGSFSDFAHFICDFAIPLYSVLRKRRLIDLNSGASDLTLEMMDRWHARLGPMLPFARQIFPGLELEYVTRYSQLPNELHRRPWHNPPDDVERFIGHLRRVLSIQPMKVGVVLVERGLQRHLYPATNYFSASGADRRCINAGFDKMVARVAERRPDCLAVQLEHLSLAEHVALFLGADTMIAQHGAALVHAHWMPRGGRVIELQCQRFQCPQMLPTIAAIRHHHVSRVVYPCRVAGGGMAMAIGDATKVSRCISTVKSISTG